VAAGGLAAAILVLAGVVVAIAASGSSSPPRPRTTTVTDQRQARTLRSDGEQIATLRATLSRQGTRLAALAASLRAAQAAGGCWQRKALHPRKTRALHCAAVT
jgi:hypothetical protein